MRQVCYYYNGDPRTIYERLGHAEVVQVALSDEQTAAQQEFRSAMGSPGASQCTVLWCMSMWSAARAVVLVQ